jgi:sugar phosphate isomerase/epimerase
MNKHISRRRILGLAIAGSASLALRSAGAVRAAPAGNDCFPFFAMDTGLRGPDVPTLEDKVKLLHDLGYWGIDYTLNHDELPRLLELLDKYGIELACVYLSPALEDKPDPRLAESVRQMKGRPTRIEMAIRSSRFKPDDPAGDKDALHMIHRVSDMAADTGPVVSIYPHTGLWTQRVQDGVRLAAASGRKNVGANFNLVHWAWVKQDQPLEKVLQQSLPHLFAITINGLDGRNIVPLDQGDYDVVAFIKLVKNIDYRGPVGLQGYGIPGPSRQSLARSMKKWREIMSSLHP